MRYYIKSINGTYAVLDLTANKQLEIRTKNIHSAVSDILLHAFTEYGNKIVGEGIAPPTKAVNITYKDGWIDINRIYYKFGMSVFLHKLKKNDKELSLSPRQLSLF